MQVLHELPGQSQPPWPQLNPTVLPSGFSLHLHIPAPSQRLVLSHHPAVPLSQRNRALSPASRAAEKRKEKPNSCLSNIHLAQTYMCPCSLLSCPIALTACWQKLRILGMEGHIPQRQPQTRSADQFDSYSIWVELAGKW